MKTKKKKLRSVIPFLLALIQMFIFTPVYADESVNETAVESTKETAQETTQETTQETKLEPSEQTVTQTVPKTTESTKEKQTENIETAKNGKDFVKRVSKLPRKYRLAASSKKRKPELKGAEGIDYGGSCVLSFDNKADYDAALKELEKQKVDYSIDANVGLCSHTYHLAGKNVKINPDAKTRIAIIDTGSDLANEKISLLGDDGSDSNGHGTTMASLILNQTDDAYIISIKAIGDNGKGKLSDVYAGVRYALDHKADYILMAISLKDSGEYDAFVSLVTECISKGIKVIASAGNNNSDATGYLPAGINGVITAGALDQEGYKLESSNYGSAVDYYIPAGSTSEAAAILSGLMIAGKASECSKTYKQEEESEEENDEDDEEVDTENRDDESEFSINKSKMTWPTKKDLVAAGYSKSSDFAAAVIKACKAMKGAEYGTGNGQADCMRYVNLAYAQALKLISGLKVKNGKIKGVKRKNGNVTYNGTSLTNSKYHLVDGCTTWSGKSPHAIGHPGGIKISKYGGLKACLKKLGAKKGSIILLGRYKKSEFKWTHAAIYTGSGTKVYDAPGGSYTTGAVHTLSDSGSGSKKYSYVAVLSFPDFKQPAKVTVKKASAKTDLTESNACYSLNGTKYGLYNTSGTLLHEFVINAEGKTDTYQINDLTKKYYVQEISAGKGYILNSKKYDVDPSKASGGTITVNADDEPIGSEGKLVIEKKDPSGWDKITGHKMSKAVFRVDYYDNTGIDSYKDIINDQGNRLINAKASVNIGFSTEANGAAQFEISAKTMSESDGSGYFSKLKGITKLPLGTYVVTEIKAPDGYIVADQSKPLIMKIHQDGNNAAVYYSADPSIFSVLEDKILLNESIIKGAGSFKKKIIAPEGIETDISLYSMEGTTYNIYYKESGKLALSMVFGEDGKVSEVIYPDGIKNVSSGGDDGIISLPAGDYTAKEIHSGYGMYLDTEEKSFTVSENNTTEIEFNDEPAFTRFDCLIKKVRNSSLSDEVLSLIPVDGAEFDIAYYAGFYENDSYKDKTPSKKWIFKTDKEGRLIYDDEHLVSGDSLFTDGSGQYIVPQGTFVITETKAPSGSDISQEIRVIVVRFAKDIVKGSKNDPANSEASRATIYNDNLSDVKDGQIIYFNEYKTSLSTMAVSTANGAKEIAADSGVSITDTLSYKNLIQGYQYKVRAWLVKSDGSVIVKPFDTVIQIKNDEERNGTLKIPFVIDASVLEGETLTVMEEIFIIDNNGKQFLYAKHDDINNTEQQITIPFVKTELIDEKTDEFMNKDNSKVVTYGKDVTISDMVSYKNLIIGNKYKITGILLEKDSGKQLLNSKGKPYKTTVEFTADKKDGVVKVVFSHVDTTMLKGPIVAGEKLTSDGIDLVTHFDLEDTDQTVIPARIKTSARDSSNNTKTITYSETANITDTVSYSGLKPGRKYQITGTLMNKATGKPYQDKDGNQYIRIVDFIPDKSEGIVEVRFENVKITYEYTEIVVFEKLCDLKYGAEIAVHEDINDTEQTVYRPQAATTASSHDGKKTISVGNKNIKITDKVMYKGFTAGKTYRAVATLYKTDGAQIMNNGNPVTNSVLFVPKKSEGTVSVPLTFNSDSIKYGESVVVFENIYDVATEEEIKTKTQETDIEIVRHNDLKNKDQTLKYDYPVIPKTGEETSPVMVIGLLLLGASAGPMWFAFRVKHGAKYRVPQQSRRKPFLNSLLCFLKRRKQDGSNRVWKNWNP